MLLLAVLPACQTGGDGSDGGDAQGTTFVTSDIDPDRVALSGLLFKPAGDGPFPAVVLLHTCGGLQPHVTQTWPRYLTGLGYAVLTFDSYAARGYGRCFESPGSRFHQIADAFGALEHLRTLPFVDGERVAVMGFSAGGFAINGSIISRNRGRPGGAAFRAAISLYAGCYGMWAYSADDLPTLQIVAEKDHRLAPGCVVMGESTALEVHLLKGAYHAFDQPQITRLRHDNKGNPMLYSYSSTREAQEVARAFLEKHLR